MLKGQLTIKTADINDAGLLTELGITIFRATFEADNRPEDMDKYVADEMNAGKISAELRDINNRFFIAWLGETAVGYAKIRPGRTPGLGNGKPMEIERLYVLHEYHGQKVGALLMNHCLVATRQAGCDIVWLGVWEHNIKARNFYDKWGFKLFGSHTFWLGNDPQTDVLMQLSLDSASAI